MITIKKTPASKLRKEVVQKLEEWGYRVFDKNAIYFTAYSDKQYAGFGGLIKLDNGIYYFGPTFIVENFRGKGIQKKLIKKRISFAKKLNAKTLWSRTDIDNVISGNNLIKCGFYLSRPKISEKLEDGRLLITLDNKEVFTVFPTEVFFKLDLDK